MLTPSPAQRVTRALQREHSRAEWDAERSAQAVREATAQHWQALQRHAEHRAEVTALAAALADRGAPTLAELAAQRQAAELADLARDTAARRRHVCAPEACPCELDEA